MDDPDWHPNWQTPEQMEHSAVMNDLKIASFMRYLEDHWPDDRPNEWAFAARELLQEMMRLHTTPAANSAIILRFMEYNLYAAYRYAALWLPVDTFAPATMLLISAAPDNSVPRNRWR